MREILFRGKAINRENGIFRTNYKNGDWVYGLITRQYDERFENLPTEMRNTEGVTNIEVDYRSIGQFTGICDKNGTKIFEGDIIANDLNTFVIRIGKYTPEYMSRVKYDSNICGVYAYCTKDKTSWHLPASIKTYQIIGNIHDNPELLKECEK